MTIPIIRSRSKICYSCDKDLYPNGKPIFDDEFAKHDSKGNWHCSNCQLTNIRRAKLRIYEPNHEKTKDFLQREEREIRAWNQMASKLTMGNIILLRLKRTGKNDKYYPYYLMLT